MGVGDYVKHEAVNLGAIGRDEAWLQQVIADDPSILGLGDVEVLARERRQHRAGRLDLLLADPSGQQRYEVELMLGATDAAHIIRCIEYWDIERRRYPAYDHIAVLVAEDLTSRFLNVLSVFSGNIPLVVLQLNALRVEGKLVLDFVRVLDQTALRRDDETPTRETTPVDRQKWVDYSGKEIIAICDSVVEMINEKARQPRQLVYRQQYIGLGDGVRTHNFAWFGPRKKNVWASFKIRDGDAWRKELEDAGLPIDAVDGGVSVNLSPEALKTNEGLLRKLAHGAVEEDEE